MTYPGAPTIYYGDEVGVGGGDDPYNRMPYPWADQGGLPDEALLADFKRLTQLRHDLPVLRHGTLQARCTWMTRSWCWPGRTVPRGR